MSLCQGLATVTVHQLLGILLASLICHSIQWWTQVSTLGILGFISLLHLQCPLLEPVEK